MTVLCRLDEIADGAARGLTPTVDGRAHDLIVLRRGARVHAYVNACPHIGTPLETFPDRFLDFSGRRLLCTTHGAQFRVEDGHCVRGPCLGRSLASVPVAVIAGRVILTGPVPPAPVPMGDQPASRAT